MRRLSIPQKPDRPDIDDLIFGEESYYGYMEDHTCSER